MFPVQDGASVWLWHVAPVSGSVDALFSNLFAWSGIVEQEGADPAMWPRGTRGGHMRYTPLATLFGYLVLTVSSALAQATTTAPGTAPGTTTAPGGGAATSGGGLANWWWIILVLVVVAAVIWYLRRGRFGRV